MNAVSRRGVIGAGVGVVGLSAIGLAAASARRESGATVSTPAPPQIPVRSRYSGSIGETFSAVSSSGSHELVLAAIDELAPAIAGQEEHRFNLIFTQSATRLDEGVYTLTSAASGESVLLLTPFGDAVDGQRSLQAIVNSAV